MGGGDGRRNPEEKKEGKLCLGYKNKYIKKMKKNDLVIHDIYLYHTYTLLIS